MDIPKGYMIKSMNNKVNMMYTDDVNQNKASNQEYTIEFLRIQSCLLFKNRSSGYGRFSVLCPYHANWR